MQIQSVNSYIQTNNTKTNQPSFKEADFIEDYVKTPYEQEMDSLYKQTQNQIEFIKYLYKDNPKKMKKSIHEISQSAFKKADALKTKYLGSKNFFQRLLKL